MGKLNMAAMFVSIVEAQVFDIGKYGGAPNSDIAQVISPAPEESINTDGIHISRSSGIKVLESNIKTGDDCVSLGDGCSDITIERVTCRPGHGISVGSLGKYEKEDPVTGVTVRNCTITGTMNGVRIKTWPDSFEGIVSNMHFEDIIVNNVGNPVLIDYAYCP
ncbi:hypothetical protein LWI28_027241 [Acer negundo]|uniref:Uncharacterized protein n=1 Tax=Acer negundo TaxID=4023 RepID=A0AAD5NRL8_ACENE|nr:hypothetical protein LWI28_027241 [Acer negundo]